MKNDLTCAVVGDLLPSYVDGLTGEESNEALRAHFSQCEHCRARYEAMKKTAEAAAEVAREVDYLNTVRKIDTGRWITSVTPDMVKTVTVDLTQVEEVYLCGALIWQDGLTISQTTNRLYHNQVDYVGDASAVHNLWDMQTPGVGSTYTIALQTEKMPYGLTVVYFEI